MSFNNIQRNLEQDVLNSSAYKALNLSTYPANYQGKISGNEWIRFNVFPSNSRLFYKGIQNNYGQIVFNIFVPAGQGMNRATIIADSINNIVNATTISGIQTTNSFITTIGIDSVDKGLFRLDLTINFNNYTQ